VVVVGGSIGGSGGGGGGGGSGGDNGNDNLLFCCIIYGDVSLQ
jgi:hypothetical protein